MACGHYRVYAGTTEPCPEAESKTRLVPKGYASREMQICDAIINEIECQRPNRPWRFICVINGKPIEVWVDSSGHCEVWKEQHYKKPIYKQFSESPGKAHPEIPKNELSGQVISAKTVKSLTTSTLASSKDNLKVRLSARLKNWIAKK